MGFVEITNKNGHRVVIHNDEVIVDQVNFKDCCELCNDPRMVHVGELVKCVGCGVINRIDYGHHA